MKTLRIFASAYFFSAVLQMGLLRAEEPIFREPPLPAIPNRAFTVTSFDAKGDGTTIDTKAVQAAIDAAAAAGGGTVLVPPGDFLCGPIRLASRIELRVETGATLRMLPLGQYPGGTNDPADFIGGSELRDVAIGGGGTIDGQGSPWWPFASEKGARRPLMISLSRCDRVLIEKLTLKNSPMFHISIGGHSTNITVRGVTIRAPASNDSVNPSRNTDACDVSGQNILIRDCDVSVGDDNFTCGGGTSNVLITHCTYGSGHGVSIGSYVNGGVSNITVEDCTFKGTEYGIRIKSDRDRGGLVSNLTFRNLRMTEVGFPILIYGAYLAPEREFRDLQKLTPETAATYPSAAVTERTPIFRDITFSDVTATVASGRRAGLIWGLPEAPVSQVVLRRVNITADRPFGFYEAKNIRLEDCTMTSPGGVNQFVTYHAEVEVRPPAAPADRVPAEHWPTGANVCVDTPLRFTFNEAPQLGTTGRIEVCRAQDGQAVETIELGAPFAVDRFGVPDGFPLRYEPIRIEGKTASVRLRTGSLHYGESYRVRLSPGVFQDAAGHDLAGPAGDWTFQTRAALPGNPDRLTVAADGSGDFCTVQGAVDRIEPHRTLPATIFIRQGRYEELVRIGRERPHVHLVGEDRRKTVIAYTNNEKLNPGWIQRAVLGIEGDDFSLENLTVQNTTPYRGSQAEAVYIKAERCTLRRANFLSYQDTLHLSGRVFVAESYIEGDVDYVWGYGTACFERCELHSLHDGCIVQARNPPERAGYSFFNCRLTAAPGAKKCWLARIETAHFPASQVAFIRCEMGAHIPPAGWQITGEAGESLRFEEFGSTDLDGRPLDLSQRAAASRQLSTEPAPGALTRALDGWDPNPEPFH